ncbi:hypothetical protein [Maribacter arcticus]|uniref:hypothetical protein n=1 Tax=Maribacter arcticus TaxID=561365 RepID=UPI0030014C5B
MTDKQLSEILKYSSPSELYIVTWNNLLKLLITPFKVRVLVDLEGFGLGEVAWVDEVKVTIELKTVFIIKGRAYNYHYFDILEPTLE